MYYYLTTVFLDFNDLVEIFCRAKHDMPYNKGICDISESF